MDADFLCQDLEAKLFKWFESRLDATKIKRRSEMKKVNEDLFDKLKYAANGSYFRLGWCVCDADGNRCDDEVVKEGRYLCVENPQDYIVLYVDKGNVLVECEEEAPDALA